MIITISREFGSGRRFTMTQNPITKQAVTIAAEKQKIIENFARQGDCINTSGLEIKKIVPTLAEYVRLWFEIRKTV